MFEFTLPFFLLLSMAMYVWWFNSTNINSIKLSPCLNLSSTAIFNTKLSNIEKIHIGKYSGPEDVVVYEGSLYTGVMEGKILRINESGVHDFASFGHPDCKSLEECGRPLGMYLIPDSPYLLVADAYLGVFNLSLEDGTYKKIFPLDNNFKVTFFNSLMMLKNGSIILTETSTKYPLHTLYLDVLSRIPSGRLLMIDPQTGDYREIARNLYFANGIEMHADGKSVLVVELTLCRIIRISLDGESPVSVFVDGLPGVPDNLKAGKHGDYWIGTSNLRDTFLGSLLTEKPFEMPILFSIVFHILSFVQPPFSLFQTHSSMILRLNGNGQVIEVFQDPQNQVTNVVGVVEYDRILYTTSYFLPYIGKLII